MRSTITIVLLLLMAASTSATIDPDPDQIGAYFDFNADINCTTATVNVPFFAYVIITNPSAAEVHGIEFSYHLESPPEHENMMFRLANNRPCKKCVDLGNNNGPLDGEYVIGLATPLPAAGSNVVFVTWQFLMLEEFAFSFYFGPHSLETLNLGLPAYEAGGYIVPLGVSSGDISLPVASVNGDCLANTNEATTFGHVKSLYR